MMSTSVQQIYEHLNESNLIFALLAEKSGDEKVRAFYQQLEADRKAMIAALTHVVAMNGEKLTHAASAAGAVNRVWLRIRDTVAPLDDAQMLAACERAEIHIHGLYDTAIGGAPPADLLRVLADQRLTIAANIVKLRSVSPAHA
ncbi:MAG: PA2169 family four-helix-bundle protein [Flavobacteriales bacterium]